MLLQVRAADADRAAEVLAEDPGPDLPTGDPPGEGGAP
jgi:hypothetical protein